MVDASKSTLYLYENVNGATRYTTDYYVTSGKNGSDIEFKIDQKTALGRVLRQIQPAKQKTDRFLWQRGLSVELSE